MAETKRGVVTTDPIHIKGYKEKRMGTSLVVQWLRIHRAMQEMGFHPW